MSFDQRLVELPNRLIVEESPATLVLPGARHGRYAERRVHLRRAISATGKSVAEAEERALGLPHHLGKSLYLFHRNAGDRRSPFRRAGCEMGLKFVWAIRIAFEIRAVGIAFAE